MRIRRVARPAGLCFVLACAVLMLTPGVALAPPEGPTVTSLSMSATVLDVTAGPQTLQVTLGAEPGSVPFPAGVTYATIQLWGPAGHAFGLSSELVYPAATFEVTFPQYVEPGTWHIDSIGLWRDQTGYNRFPETLLISSGLPTTVEVISNPDRTPPWLTALTFPTDPLDLRGSPQTLPVSVAFSDDLAGVGSLEILFSGPEGGQAMTRLFPPPGSSSGVMDVVFEPWEDAGIWHIEELSVSDRVGNRRIYGEADLVAAGFPTTIETASTHDTTPPVLTGLSLYPGVIYTGGGPVWLYVGLQVTDDLSGLLVTSDDYDYYAEVTFQGPHGQYLWGDARVPSTWAKIEFPSGTEAGTWTLHSVELHDQRVNSRTYGTAELAALGLPTTIEVRTGTPPPSFTDVGLGGLYAPAIWALSSLGVVGGYHTGDAWEYRPENPIWRAQFAKMIDGAMKLDVSEDLVAPFTDLGMDDPSDLYPHEYVAAAAAAGITVGTAPGLFSPYVNISRAQVVTMIIRAAQSQSPTRLQDLPAGYAGTLGAFDPVHGPAMASGEYNGILDGLDGFGVGWDPWQAATRGEVAQMLWNLMWRPAG